MKKITLILLLTFLPAAMFAGISEKEITYRAGGTTMKGFLAWDSSVKGKRPGVIVVHEWWGHNDYARKRARMLAKMGYTAFALDMYGDGRTADHPKTAGAFSSAVTGKLAAGRFNAAMDVLHKHESVDPSKTAAIGYCFGGKVVLEMARSGADLKAVASFHGSPATKSPAGKGKVKAKLLVMNGADDVMVTAEQIELFKKEMKNAGADMKFINYPGARHSFTNPAATGLGKKFGIPVAYNKKADKKSWKELTRFLKEIFK